MKPLLLPLLFFLSTIAIAQIPGSTYYGKDATRYKGKWLKVVSSPNSYTYFMVDKTRPWNEPGNTYLPGSLSMISDPNKIFGKEFQVVDVTKEESGDYVLELKEKQTGEQVFYLYGADARTAFPMQVIDEEGNAVSEPVDYCSLLEYEKDKSTGKRSYSNPYKSRYNIRVYKDIGKNKLETYTLGLYTTGSTVTMNAKGFIILLDNGAKIVRPAIPIDVDVREYDTHGFGDFDYSVYWRLTAADRALLVKHRITDFRLYIYDQEIGETDGTEIREYLKCLMSIK